MLITHNLLDGIIKIYLERLAQDELSNFNYTLSQYQRSNTLELTRIQNSLGSNLVIGGGRGDRTHDLMLAKHALSQLSYAPTLNNGGSGRT